VATLVVFRLAINNKATIQSNTQRSCCWLRFIAISICISNGSCSGAKL
jgi:hypothetical protein